MLGFPKVWNCCVTVVIIDIVKNHIRMRPLSQLHCDFDNIKTIMSRLDSYVLFIEKI